MHIVFFSRLFVPHIGGVEKHVFEISRLLIKKDHLVTVITEQHSKELKLNENIKGIEVFRIPYLKDGKLKKIKIWKWLFEHKNLITNADIVHCHDIFFWYLPFRFLYPFKKVYTTFHGYESYPIKKKSIWVRKISEKLSDGNICIGEFMKKWYGTKADYVSYGGINAFDIKNQILNIKNNNSAVFIGRLDEQTGIFIYADAVKIIRKKIPDFKFEIIGDGKFRKEIEKNFKVLGFQKNPEKYFSKYNFAFVSRYLSIMEAMAAKILVFAVYDNPLKEDYLKMAPFAKFINIVNSENELAEKALFFLKNQKEEKIIVDKAFEWVRKHTWEEVANEYLKLWRKN